MTCEEFRIQYNSWLDGRKSSPLPPEAAHHARMCSGCGMYARLMVRIDGGLMNIPHAPVPEEILAFPGSRPAHAPDIRRRLSSRVRTGASLTLPPLLVWSISLIVPPPWQFAFQTLLVSGAMVLFAVTSLRPRFIS
jgi:hypothetical protein